MASYWKQLALISAAALTACSSNEPVVAESTEYSEAAAGSDGEPAYAPAGPRYHGPGAAKGAAPADYHAMVQMAIGSMSRTVSRVGGASMDSASKARELDGALSQMADQLIQSGQMSERGAAIVQAYRDDQMRGALDDLRRAERRDAQAAAISKLQTLLQQLEADLANEEQTGPE